MMILCLLFLLYSSQLTLETWKSIALWFRRLDSSSERSSVAQGGSERTKNSVCYAAIHWYHIDQCDAESKITQPVNFSQLLSF